MDNETTYISERDFHNSKKFQKINNHVDTCLTLIERLIAYNSECRQIVNNQLNIETYTVDYRIDQFAYYENTLKSIYYSCYSLKHVFDSSTYMNIKGIKNTIGHTFDNQKRYITFTALVKMSSMFEYARKKYEKNVKTKKGTSYFDQLRLKYANKVDSIELLNDFRNTIHSNAKWEPKNGTDILTYELREGKQIINPGETFKYDHWKIYTIFRDCIELNKLMALDNEAERVRQTRINVNGQNLVSVQTNMTLKDWDDLFDQNSTDKENTSA